MEKKDFKFFEDNLWKELNRYGKNGDFIQTVTCTDENIFNLFHSQSKKDTRYGEVFRYTLYK
jgi:hypothetical protein